MIIIVFLLYILNINIHIHSFQRQESNSYCLNQKKSMKNMKPLNTINCSYCGYLNSFMIELKPDRQEHEIFGKIIGKSIFSITFAVSWYIFSDSNSIPNSILSAFKLVNSKKPYFLSAMRYINNRLENIVELPLFFEDNHNYIHAYISYPNKKGQLIPLAAQSFYQDSIVDIKKRKYCISLNTDILEYWHQLGYL